ncbi:MAG TPA: protein-glutamate O-methyltransferase CheR [Gemmatimonadales bacterium]|nr:protein-glutamate O-methyltransferase CheR [Gemmatimonadales bacterium]
MSEDDAGFDALTRKISREAGLSLHAYKDKCLRRRIAVRMRACGVHSFAAYQAVLDGSPAEYERLKDAITINVTRFYRNADTWNVLRNGFLHEVCQGSGEVRAWSAGCSSGEEPYTLALLIADYFDRQGRPERLGMVSVDATDIDRECLQQAQAGYYRREALADVPADLAERYFEADGDGYRVIERVRRRIVVRSLDLSRDPPPRRNYQLILCRNVVIYFGRETQERVFLAFAEALAPGGILVLGKVESLFGPARERLTLLDPRERVYRRTA